MLTLLLAPLTEPNALDDTVICMHCSALKESLA